MRQLLANDFTQVSAGCGNNGYNFTYIVTTAAVWGVTTALFMDDFWIGAKMGAGFAGLMFVANAADSVYFDDQRI